MDETTKLKIYMNAVVFSRDNNQVVGEKNDYYITIAQLETLLREG